MNLTNRHGGIDILWADMKRQTEQDFELVIVDALWKEREKEVLEYINDPRLKYIRQSDKREGAHTNLAHADNEGFRACTADLIVCLQDYQWIPGDGLEKYLYYFQKDPRALVTGVGHHYSDPRSIDSTGKITVFEKPYTGRPENLSWSDPRMVGPSFREANPVEWELNWASIPRSVIQDLGGMDEEYDFRGFAFDNTNIATRAQFVGCKIYLDLTNEVMGFDHDLWWPNPLKVNRISPMDFHIERMNLVSRGEFPVKLGYL